MDALSSAVLQICQAVRRISLEESRGLGLTPVQAQTLLWVERTKSFATTIGALARHLGATNASTVETVNSLAGRGLLRREPSAADRRTTLLRLTTDGYAAIDQRSTWGAAVSRALAGLTAAQRSALTAGLDAVLAGLREAGYLDGARPCRGCRFFTENTHSESAAPHYCALLSCYLSESEAQKDCPDHQPKPAEPVAHAGIT